MENDKELFIKENIYQIRVGLCDKHIALFFISPETFCHKGKKLSQDDIKAYKEIFKEFNIPLFLTDKNLWASGSEIIKTCKI